VKLSEAIKTRQSIRAYLEEPVSAEEVAEVVEAGRWAPNAGPFHISVIRNETVLRKINDLTHQAMEQSSREFLRERAALPGYEPLYGAPVVLLLSAPVDSPYGAFNAALAAENMIIQATVLGLGSCFVVSPGLTLKGEGSRSLATEAGIPDGYEFQCAVLLGHTADEDRFSLGERKQKGTVEYLD